MARSITEIVKDAHAAADLQVLIELWNEIANKKIKPMLATFCFVGVSQVGEVSTV